MIPDYHHVYVYKHVYMHTQARTHAHTHTHTHTRTHTYAHIHTHTHMCVCVYCMFKERYNSTIAMREVIYYYCHMKGHTIIAKSSATLLYVTSSHMSHHHICHIIILSLPNRVLHCYSYAWIAVLLLKYDVLNYYCYMKGIIKLSNHACQHCFPANIIVYIICI